MELTTPTKILTARCGECDHLVPAVDYEGWVDHRHRWREDHREVRYLLGSRQGQREDEALTFKLP